MKYTNGLLALGHSHRFFKRNGPPKTTQPGGATAVNESKFGVNRQEVMPILSLLNERLPPNSVSPVWREALDTFFEEVEWTWSNFLRYVNLFFRSGRITERDFGSLVEDNVWNILESVESASKFLSYITIEEIPLDKKVFFFVEYSVYQFLIFFSFFFSNSQSRFTNICLNFSIDWRMKICFHCGYQVLGYLG